jgi:cell division protein FtsL
MSARGFKLRSVVVWMALVLLTTLLPLGLVWKQYAYVNLSRALENAEKDRGSLQNEVMLLETQVGELKEPSRLEELARDHFGLIDAGPPIMVQAEGQVLASNSQGSGAAGATPAASGGEDTLKMKTASWHGWFR